MSKTHTALTIALAAALGFVAGGPLIEQAQAEESAFEPVERWEYCQVKVYRQDARALSDDEDYWRVEGYWGCEVASSKKWKYPAQALNELGADGWRLVPDSATPWSAVDSEGSRYLLERRLR